ncbi:MAG: hypothetical protein J5605_04705 [Bacteroidales bacterium]|nr:hypothetical protein [Bacteroidales bacterium]
MVFQVIITGVIVAAAVAFLVVTLRRKLTSTDCGCGGGSDCKSKKSGGCASCPLYDKNVCGCTDRNASAKDCGCDKK